jgi:hypothetical protein
MTLSVRSSASFTPAGRVESGTRPSVSTGKRRARRIAPARISSGNAFQQWLAQELGEDRVVAQREAEAAQQRKEREQESRWGSIARMTELGASEEEAARLLERIVALQPKMDARAKELIPENATPEQRKAFEVVIKTELEQAAAEIMGAEKAKALIQNMERNTKP